MNLENFNVKVVKKNQNNDLRLNSVHFQCHYSVELAKENTSYAISQSSVSSDKLYKLHKFLKPVAAAIIMDTHFRRVQPVLGLFA